MRTRKCGDAFTAGTTAARVGGYGLLIYLSSGALQFTSTDIAVVNADNTPVFGGDVAVGIYARLNPSTGSSIDFGTGHVDVDAVTPGSALTRSETEVTADWSSSMAVIREVSCRILLESLLTCDLQVTTGDQPWQA